MNKLLSFVLMLFTLTAFGQVDPGIWENLQTVKTDHYELKVPSNWR